MDINSIENTKFVPENIYSLWVSYYPKGEYSISYLKINNNCEAAAYIVKKNETKYIIKYVESEEKKIEDIVPIIEGSNVNIMVSIQ